MFGLFSKKFPANKIPSLEARAREAVAHIAGQVRGNQYVLQGATIDFAYPETRSKLLAAFKETWAGLSKNRENWPNQLGDLFDAYDLPTTSAYQKAATHLLAGLIKADIVCRAACEYPKDAALSRIATTVLMRNLTAFNHILTGEQAPQLWKSSPGLEILRELEYANAFFERCIGFR
ncbi:hypothetical protein [Hyphomicrobium sp.]|uniref:hypothetical protein n=1 Tax=Hyphomicrobium sp. TaxID=82 RepID=UPI002FE2F644